MLILTRGRFSLARIERRVGALALGVVWYTDKDGFYVGLLLGPLMPSWLLFRARSPA